MAAREADPVAKRPLSEKQQAIADLFALHLQKAGCPTNEAIALGEDLTREGWRVPQPRALPEFDLNHLQGARPPWAWMNLDEDQADTLEAALHAWVVTYNDTMVLEAGDIIPACWRWHPPLVQLLPVLFWSWHNTHRHPQATAAAALDWHLRMLPTFQARLDRMVGDNAARCRRGEHEVGDELLSADAAEDLLETCRSYRPDGLDLDRARSQSFGTR